ncbi:MAG: metalloprotease family protein [Christensenellaceae bacterium]|jgi:hypothetical protein|nr:metalloprotease family protein [Christensenellaceae bacterium]
MQPLLESIFQFLYIVLPIVSIGLAINILMTFTIKFAGKIGKPLIYTSGIIGVPIHELSHVIMCIIFKHKIQEVRFFKPDKDNNTLGYVLHVYNKKSLYQRAGSFFIGIAPIVVGALLMIVLLNLITPTTSSSISRVLALKFASNGSTLNRIGSVFVCTMHMVIAFFNPKNLLDPGWWIFTIIACCIAMHMRLSASDIKGSITGIIVVVLILFIINIIIQVLFGNTSLREYLNSFYTSCSYIMTVMLFSLLFNVIVFLFFAILSPLLKQKPTITQKPQQDDQGSEGTDIET